MIAGFGLLPFQPGGMLFGPTISWLLLVGAVALASGFLWWTGREIRPEPPAAAYPRRR